MKRIFVAMLFALPFFVLAGQTAQAQGCGGFCFKFLGGLHQHGPLYNYGPYSGYYPFEPYGPWNAQLQYTGPYPGNAACGWNGCGGRCGVAGGCGGAVAGCGRATTAGWGTASSGCASTSVGSSCASSSRAWGGYAVSTFKNVFHRSHPLCNRAKLSTGCSAAPASGCASCGSVASASPTRDGNPASVVAAPSLQSVSGQIPADMLSASYSGRER